MVSDLTRGWRGWCCCSTDTPCPAGRCDYHNYVLAWLQRRNSKKNKNKKININIINDNNSLSSLFIRTQTIQNIDSIDWVMVLSAHYFELGPNAHWSISTIGTNSVHCGYNLPPPIWYSSNWNGTVWRKYIVCIDTLDTAIVCTINTLVTGIVCTCKESGWRYLRVAEQLGSRAPTLLRGIMMWNQLDLGELHNLSLHHWYLYTQKERRNIWNGHCPGRPNKS